jgi:hypothetical protein
MRFPRLVGLLTCLGAGAALALAPSSAAAQSPSGPADCANWQQCRELSLSAADAGDHERAHDLAWRAVQTGPRHSPELMYLLARAQSLSGRPGDALVLLRRLAEMGVATDAESEADFRRVRSLPGWVEVEALASGASMRITLADIAWRPGEAPGTAVAPALSAAAAPPASTAPASSPARLATPPAAVRVEEALRLRGIALRPGSLAYDGVSSRFLIGGLSERKIIVVNERSQRVDDLVRADSAGFRDIVALEIDRARGDLWVISDEPGTEHEPGHGNGSGGVTARGASARLHKLQLVAGRPLATFEPPALQPAPRFTELAVTPAGTVIVLDGPGSRLFRTTARSRTLDLALAGGLEAPVSVAAADNERIVYVARLGGVSRVDLARRTVAPVAPAGLDLARIERMWWHGGALVAVQATNEATRRIVRVGLDGSGTAATFLQVIDAGLPGGREPIVGALWGDDLFYAMHAADGGSQGDRDAGSRLAGPAQIVVRRARLGAPDR